MAHRSLRACLAAAALALVAGCATPQSARLLAERPAAAPVALDVPFVAQTEDSCGPASLAMVLRHAGRAVEPERLEAQTLIPGRGGSLQAEMLAATRRHGLMAYRLAPELREVVDELDHGRPVVVLVNLAFNWSPRWHYAVLTGYDVGRREFRVHSGTRADQRWSFGQFERLWARGGRWSFVVLEPGALPAAPDEARYVAAALDLERTAGLGRAEPAYRRALERWPDDLPALIGAGNAAYGRGDKAGAAVLFERAAAAHPHSPVAANNLAQTLHDLGRSDEARRWALRAVDNGGGAAAQETLRAIDGPPDASSL